MKKTAGIGILLSIFLLSGCMQSFQPNMDRDLGSFSYTNQNGDTVSNEDLAGTPVIANFIFTNCDTVCPPMTYNMAGVQEAIEEEGIEDYRIVSFSVDPERDDQETLKAFMSRYEMNEEKWDFLTGYEFEEISNLALESFQGLVIDDPNTDQMSHPTSFYLIDEDGNVVKSYDGVSDVPEDEIVSDLKAVSSN
ncbi:SCO family protein [Jeotgalibacillus aurantiacus]|uniref:SCO family protein n=1 Tax=Jeotgalibacillus aurantiacus TaxID=2763266 RepID=UPI001D0A2D18|nr:SCO family protein [Jeotgalibacillus aurantiacus]